MAVTIGGHAYLDLGLSPLDMLFPATVALVLRLFLLQDSPIHVPRYRGSPRWILYGFLLLTVVYGALTLSLLLVWNESFILQALGGLLTTLWTLLVFFVAGRSSKQELRRAELQLGDTSRAVRLVLGAVVFLALQAGLNLVVGLGTFRGVAERIYGIAVPDRLYPPALVVAFALAVTGIPLSGLAVVFGEEYGWRGFLQDELAELGRRPAALLTGLVWGVWHVPVMLSGVHTYPATELGIGLGLVFFLLWGFVQSYAVLKTRSIWVAAFLHGLVNSVYGFTTEYIVRPESRVLSFGLGVYGLACLAAVVLVLLRDPVWEAASDRAAQASATTG